MPNLSLIITFQEMFGRWYQAWWKQFLFQFVNTLRPIQNGRYFPDDIFKRIFLNENVWISIKISLKFVPADIFSDRMIILWLLNSGSSCRCDLDTIKPWINIISLMDKKVLKIKYSFVVWEYFIVRTLFHPQD